MKDKIYGFIRECNLFTDEIIPMKESPFKVRNDTEMRNLVESIRQFGILEPLMVRKVQKDLNVRRYEIISGNRRYEACKQLGIKTIPVRLVDMMKDSAIIAMIDSNLCHRESILPSEKAAAYKMRLEAMKRQGFRTDLEENTTSSQLGTKSDTGTIKELLNSTTAECKIPNNLLKEFAKCLLPDIVAFSESDKGKKLYEDWKLKRETNKVLNLKKAK